MTETAREMYAAMGVDGVVMLPQITGETFWRVHGTDTVNGGSCSFAAKFSIETARAHLRALRSDPQYARYTVWEIVQFEPWTHAHVLTDEEVTEETPRKMYEPKYVVTGPSHFKKGYTVHNTSCRYFDSYGPMVVAADIPAEAVNCKICGGKR